MLQRISDVLRQNIVAVRSMGFGLRQLLKTQALPHRSHWSWERVLPSLGVSVLICKMGIERASTLVTDDTYLERCLG